jgi:hypothetical protein
MTIFLFRNEENVTGIYLQFYITNIFSSIHVILPAGACKALQYSSTINYLTLKMDAGCTKYKTICTDHDENIKIY